MLDSDILLYHKQKQKSFSVYELNMEEREQLHGWPTHMDT